MNDFPDNFVTDEELVARGAHHHPFPCGADGAEGAQLHDQAGKTSLVLGPGVLVQIVREIQPGLLYLVLLASTGGRQKFANIISRSMLLAKQMLNSKESVGNSLQAIWTEHKLPSPLPPSTSPSSPSLTLLPSCHHAQRDEGKIPKLSKFRLILSSTRPSSLFYRFLHF